MHFELQQNPLSEPSLIFLNTSLLIYINSSCFIFSGKSYEVASSLIYLTSLETIIKKKIATAAIRRKKQNNKQSKESKNKAQIKKRKTNKNSKKTEKQKRLLSFSLPQSSLFRHFCPCTPKTTLYHPANVGKLPAWFTSRSSRWTRAYVLRLSSHFLLSDSNE